jgi:hypothetical protein
MYVIVNAIVESRDALLIEMGVLYGPPATLNSLVGGVKMTCAGVSVPAAPGSAGTGVAGSRGGVPGGTPVPAGGTAPTGGIGGG